MLEVPRCLLAVAGTSRCARRVPSYGCHCHSLSGAFQFGHVHGFSFNSVLMYKCKLAFQQYHQGCDLFQSPCEQALSLLA